MPRALNFFARQDPSSSLSVVLPAAYARARSFCPHMPLAARQVSTGMDITASLPSLSPAAAVMSARAPWPIQLSLRGRIFAAQTRTLASRRPTLSHARDRDARQGHPGTRFVSRSCDPRFADAPMTLLPPPSTRQTIVPAVASPNAIPSPPALARPSAPSTRRAVHNLSLREPG